MATVSLWDSIAEALVALMKEAAEGVEGESIAVHGKAITTLTDNAGLILYPPGRIISRGAGIRRTVYDVLIRAYVRDRDLASQVIILDRIGDALIEIVDRNVALGGRGHISLQTLERPGTISIGDVEVLVVDCTLAIEAFEPATFGTGI